VKPKKSKPKAWRLPVSKSGGITLPLDLREAAFLWEGDAVQASVAHDADGYFINLCILPHGLTREQIHRAEKRILRELARDKKAGRLGRFQKRISRLHSRLIAEALASGPAKPFRKRDFEFAIARGRRRAEASKTHK
jgi:hypothetical protein